MTKLMPCPFCGNELGRKTGRINPMARCITEGCIVAEKMFVINLDDPVSVERWSTRAEPAAAPVTGREDCDWPDGQLFTYHDEPGEHDPCYVVQPGGPMMALNHHAGTGVDIARAKFIVAACNAALSQDAIRSLKSSVGAPAQCEPSDHVAVPKAALDWLFGEAPDEIGQWFGYGLRPSNKPYWWRAKFRNMIPALSSTDGGGEPAPRVYFGTDVKALCERLLHGSDDHETSMALRREAASALLSTGGMCPDCGRAVDGPTHAAYCAVTSTERAKGTP